MRLQTMIADAPVALHQQANQRREQRQDQRHQVNQSATMSVLGTAAEALHGKTSATAGLKSGWTSLSHTPRW
jgi:hypothetical protein